MKRKEASTTFEIYLFSDWMPYRLLLLLLCIFLDTRFLKDILVTVSPCLPHQPTEKELGHAVSLLLSYDHYYKTFAVWWWCWKRSEIFTVLVWFSACPVCYLPVEEAIALMPNAPSFSPLLKNLTYIYEEPLNRDTEFGGSDFGGYPTLRHRNDSFDIKDTMSVHCG